MTPGFSIVPPVAVPLTADDRARRLAALRAARRKGTDWLLAQLNPDGSMGDPRDGFTIYRAPGRSPRSVRPRPRPRPAPGSGRTS